jgi:hypothetical protein
MGQAVATGSPWHQTLAAAAFYLYKYNKVAANAEFVKNTLKIFGSLQN